MAHTASVKARIETIADLAERAVSLERPGGRVLVGLAGAPGSGKSLAAAAVERQINEATGGPRRALALPMDGFHHSSEYLSERGLLDSKGTPETFDATALVERVRQLKADLGPLWWPTYSRETHDPVLRGIRVENESLVILEGNYLFVEHEPWDALNALFDERWFLTSEWATTRSRLVRRQLRGGKDEREAALHVDSVDRPNAVVVGRTERVADVVVSLSSGDPGLQGVADSATGTLFQVDSSEP